jgi:hypothetical protein
MNYQNYANVLNKQCKNGVLRKIKFSLLLLIFLKAD